MYYDLIASLPNLPYFARAERLPITPLRLEQRMRLLKPEHAKQLVQVEPMVRWRPRHLLGKSDTEFVAEYRRLIGSPLDARLREFVDFRMDQQTLLAALRRKRAGFGLPEGNSDGGVGPRTSHVRKHWAEPDFHLSYVYPWLPQARELLETSDAHGLERLQMDVVWRWLDRCAEQNMFSFPAVFSYFFKWDLLQAWLANNVEAAKVRFRTLVDQVTNVERK